MNTTLKLKEIVSNKMKISYLITCSTETDTLKKLLELILNVLGDDELIVLNDKDNTSEDTKKILIELAYKFSYNIVDKKNIKIIENSLAGDYGLHKNTAIEKCEGNFIFAIDGDELPSELTIGENLHAIIETNPEIECFVVPRLNLFEGVTLEHAKKWGWKLSMSKLYNKPVVNFPDIQYRIFKNSPKIRYKRKLHERIEGYESYSVLPLEEEWCLLHNKTIEKQEITNIKYNELFTPEENQGFSHKF